MTGIRALVLFALSERRCQTGELLMNGIAVDASVRGRAIGSGPPNRLIDYARDRGFQRIRLDVVDTNPRARRLYERMGFTAVKGTRHPWLRRKMGFSAATTMVLHPHGPVDR